MPKISVIVPVYNGEKFVDKTIESVLNQTFKDFELILINDGSTDNSLEVLKKYQKKDKRVVIINQKNRGFDKTWLSEIKAVKSKYVLWFSHDDEMHSDMLFELYKVAKREKSDVIASTEVGISNDKVIYSFRPKQGKNVLKLSLKKKINFIFVGYLVNTSLTKKQSKFKNYISRSHEIALKSNKVSVATKAKWFYFMHKNSDSITTGSNDIEFYSYKYLKSTVDSLPDKYKGYFLAMIMRDMVDTIPYFSKKYITNNPLKFINEYGNKKAVIYFKKTNLAHYCIFIKNYADLYKQSKLDFFPKKDLKIAKSFKNVTLKSSVYTPSSLTKYIELCRYNVITYALLSQKNIKTLNVYGSGSLLPTFIKICKNENIKIKNIIDSDQKKHGRLVDGIKIVSLQKAYEKNANTPIFIASKTYHKDIKSTIKSFAKENNLDIKIINKKEEF